MSAKIKINQKKKMAAVAKLVKKKARKTPSVRSKNSYGKEIKIPVKIIGPAKIKRATKAPMAQKMLKSADTVFVRSIKKIAYKERRGSLTEWKKMFVVPKNESLMRRFAGKLKVASSVVLILALVAGQTFAVSGFEAHKINVTARICGLPDCSIPAPTPTPVFACVLSLSKQVDISEAEAGDTLTYTLNFSNSGTADCTGGGVKIKDVVSDRLIFMSETHSDNVSRGYGKDPLYKSSTRTLLWNAHALEPGESGFVSWKGKIKNTKMNKCGGFDISNIGSITAEEYSNFADWVDSNEVRTSVGEHNSHSDNNGNKCHVDDNRDDKDELLELEEGLGRLAEIGEIIDLSGLSGGNGDLNDVNIFIKEVLKKIEEFSRDNQNEDNKNNIGVEQIIVPFPSSTSLLSDINMDNNLSDGVFAGAGDAGIGMPSLGDSISVEKSSPLTADELSAEAAIPENSPPDAVTPLFLKDTPADNNTGVSGSGAVSVPLVSDFPTEP